MRCRLNTSRGEIALEIGFPVLVSGVMGYGLRKPHAGNWVGGGW